MKVQKHQIGSKKIMRVTRQNQMFEVSGTVW